jgi:hypothetical protein
MNNDIIAIAREAGGGTTWWPLHTDTLERFAELARADEREACAKFFEEHWRETWTDEQVAEAIRARGKDA